MANLVAVPTTTVPIAGSNSSVQSIQSDDRVVNLIQSNIVPKINQLIANPMTQGVLLQKLTLTSGDNVIPHGLNRPMVGWFTTRIRTNAVSLYDTNDSSINNNTSLYLYINASTGCVIDLYIF